MNFALYADFPVPSGHGGLKELISMVRSANAAGSLDNSDVYFEPSSDDGYTSCFTGLMEPK